MYHNSTECHDLNIIIRDDGGAWFGTRTAIHYELLDMYDRKITTDEDYSISDQRDDFSDVDLFTLAWPSMYTADTSRSRLQRILTYARKGAYLLYIENSHSTFGPHVPHQRLEVASQRIRYVR